MSDRDVEAPLLQRKARWQGHWVNGTGFTISMATYAVGRVPTFLLHFITPVFAAQLAPMLPYATP